jgi:hypothetical protein
MSEAGFQRRNPGHPIPRHGTRRAQVRLRLEQLEDRTLLSNFIAATASDLIADINAANAAGGTNTITLTAPTGNPYALTAVNNTTDGANGLPVISGGGHKVAADNLTIIGNADTIEGSTASGTPAFRLFDVAGGASLTLKNLTLQNGLAFGSGAAAEGGAVYNQGTLVLSTVTVQNNEAEGSNGANAKNASQNGGNGQDAAGGGIWSNGSLNVENGTLVQNNKALGGGGGNAAYGNFGQTNSHGGTGGTGSGGGVYVAGGTATLVGGTLSGNVAQGGPGGAGLSYRADIWINVGQGGNGSGGGLDVAAGTVTLTSVIVDSNSAHTGVNLTAIGNGATPGFEYGGGIYVGGGTVALCNDTVESNSATGVGPGYGGGLYLGGATVYIDTPAVDSADPTVVNNNTDSSGTNGSTANIDGSYILQNC